MKRLLIEKALKEYNKGEKYEYSFDDFCNDAKRYIKAIKEGRMLCNIDSVSASGMSRTLKFIECSKSKYDNQYHYLNFYRLFDFFGYAKAGKYKDYFRIYGCGMDMVFATNNSIIYDLKRYGFINDKNCRVLSQKTPSVI